MRAIEPGWPHSVAILHASRVATECAKQQYGSSHDVVIMHTARTVLQIAKPVSVCTLILPLGCMQTPTQTVLLAVARHDRKTKDT